MDGARRAIWTAATLAALATAATGCGKDELKCPAGQTACGSVCVDTASDPNNCRFCGIRCPTGASCTPTGCQCPAGQAGCGGACVSLSAEPNCGACGHACGPLGTCSTLTVPASCDCGTYASCGSSASPECVNTATDSFNCGTCGHRCGLGTCGSGICTCTASPDIIDCAGASPQCVNKQTDERNCGACGNVCPAGQACDLGVCCPAGQTNCSGTCRDLLTSHDNCGACGTVCGVSETCRAGHCCGSGLTWCGTACVNTFTDPSNCGTCGHACSASQVCAGATCLCQAPTPLACGTNCCAGTACCTGNACQLPHSNGLGQSYYDCGPLGTPGNGATYTAAMAVKAGEAWAPGSTANPAFPCGGGYCNAVVAGGKCAVWCYQSLLAGYVNLNSLGITCICPTTASQKWY